MEKIFDNPILMVIAVLVTSAVFHFATEYLFGEANLLIGAVVSGCFLGVHVYRNYWSSDNKFKKKY
jgi:hypothetical protein